MYRAEPTFVAALAVAGWLAFVPPAPAGASPADSPADLVPADVVSQEIEVRLAEIEVVVTDRRGEPVAGLGREDFAILLDGRPVALTHFRAVDDRAPAAGEVAAVPSAVAAVPSAATAPPALAAASDVDRLNLVIYIDRGYLELGDLNDVRAALKGFLRQSLRPGDRAMLVSAGHSLELVHGFTSVPELVVAELDGIRERPGGSRFAKEYASIQRDMERVKNQGSDFAARDLRQHARAFISQIQAFAAEIEGEIGRTTGHLEQLVQSIAGLPGRRAVIYVGGRVPAVYPRRLFETWDSAFGRFSNVQIPDVPGTGGGGGDGGGGDGGGGAASAQGLASDAVFDTLAAASSVFDVDAGRRVEEVGELASIHGVVFYTLDASSLRGSGSLFAAASDTTLSSRGSTMPGPMVAPGSLADAMGSLRSLAWETGGRDFAGSRDFRGALARIDGDLKTYYSLGFEPLDLSQAEARVEVRLADRVGRDPLEVRHRPRIKLKDRDTLEAERTLSALLLEETENPLQVEVSPGEGEVMDGGWRVPVTISVPLSKLALVADGRFHAGRLSIYAVSGTLGGVGSVVKAVVPVRIANQDLLTSLGRRVAYRLQLSLRSSPVRIAVTVRDDFRPGSSTARASFRAGSPAGSASSEAGLE